ncbi:predicted protein [Plenodomus lingam JN3]|uniref:Predicted protein n=1 Tax=Leptosphaeria maculans (strain JN3 / isolate v23.1.3 / race Av1-4-5-6-7-8) TaxID=985895 RepID=E5A455_LEPMJ|nr:predicted protein [Plenodomus lingam JN3]CBX98400.1 predicted protein [Plenodomus lingam JN3]
MKDAPAWCNERTTSERLNECIQYIQWLLIKVIIRHIAQTALFLALRKAFVSVIGTLNATSCCGQRTRSRVCTGSARLNCGLTFNQVGVCPVTGLGASRVLDDGSHPATHSLLESLSKAVT